MSPATQAFPRASNVSHVIPAVAAASVISGQTSQPGAPVVAATPTPAALSPALTPAAPTLFIPAAYYPVTYPVISPAHPHTGAFLVSPAAAAAAVGSPVPHSPLIRAPAAAVHQQSGHAVILQVRFTGYF